MTASPEQQRQASDPSTPGATLADLAAAHPDLRAAIALNPSTYPGLLDWLRQYGDSEVQAALARRTAAAVPPPPPPPARPAPPPPPAAAPAAAYAPAPGYAPGYAAAPGYPATTGYGYPMRAPRPPFVEPTRSVPLTSGTYDSRYGLALGALGLAFLLYVLGFFLAFTDAYWPLYESAWQTGNYAGLAAVRTLVAVLPLLAIGAALAVIPARSTSRGAALGVLGIALLVTIGQWADWPLQELLRYGSVLTFVAVIAAWLVVRDRPGRSYAVLPILLIPAALDTFLFWDFWGPTWLIFPLAFSAFLVGTAWLGRAIAPSAPRAGTPVSPGSPATPAP